MPKPRSLPRTIQRHLVCGILALWGAGVATAADGEPIRLEVGSWSPYIDFAAPDLGLLTVQVQSAFLKAGVRTALREMSWKTAQDRIDHAGAVSFGWIRTEAREARWHYSLPICHTRTVLIMRTEQPVTWNQLEQLKPIRLGWSRGYSYGNALDRLRPELNVTEMNDDVVALKRLLLGSVDAALMDPLVARQLIQQRFSAEDARRFFIDLDPHRTLEKIDLHVVCAKSSAVCLPALSRFNRGLKLIRGDGPAPACGELHD